MERLANTASGYSAAEVADELGLSRSTRSDPDRARGTRLGPAPAGSDLSTGVRCFRPGGTDSHDSSTAPTHAGPNAGRAGRTRRRRSVSHTGRCHPHDVRRDGRGPPSGTAAIAHRSPAVQQAWLRAGMPPRGRTPSKVSAHVEAMRAGTGSLALPPAQPTDIARSPCR
ncbi:hypothetical protein ACFWPK_21495 [Nocardia sp. NPDC058519]|uniref:hypothetical protein n=1 Tax=Nocardia sp. NPDC058519 TaxID=3346535 RepID=UPI00366612DE